MFHLCTVTSRRASAHLDPCGTKIFLSNFVRLYQALDQAGQSVKLDIYEGMPHVFVPSLPETAESQVAIAKVRDWVSEHLLDD